MKTLVQNFNQTTEGFNFMGKAVVVLVLITIAVCAVAVAVGVLTQGAPNFSY